MTVHMILIDPGEAKSASPSQAGYRIHLESDGAAEIELTLLELLQCIRVLKLHPFRLGHCYATGGQTVAGIQIEKDRPVVIYNSSDIFGSEPFLRMDLEKALGLDPEKLKWAVTMARRKFYKQKQ